MMLRDTIKTMDTATGYKPYEKILDAVSLALAFASWIAASALQGDIRVNLPDIFLFGSYPFLFFLIFLSGLLVIVLIAGADILLRIGALAIRAERLKRRVAILSTGLITALILFGYTHVFFSKTGGWLMSGGRGLFGGLGGGLGGFFFELTLYFLVALLARALLAAKKKLHRRFNTSVALFLIVLAASLPALYFIFFAAR